METKEEILSSVEKYLEEFTNEKTETDAFVSFVKANDNNALTDRKNFAGHITTSAFIIPENGDELLLLKHKFLNRWLQPGGHVDVSDSSLYASALREAVEETGLPAGNLQLISNKIFDIDSHRIPTNDKKMEPSHVHHDVRFLFRCVDGNPLDICIEESTDGRWFSFSELANNPDFFWVENKVKTFLQKQLF